LENAQQINKFWAREGRRVEEKRNERKDEIRRGEQLFSAQFVLHTRNEWTFLIL
jgi:hypothetical protein